MARSLRILHTADSHIGVGLPGRVRHNGPRRGDDLVSSFTHPLSTAVERGINLVIHAGDLFDRSKPSSQALVSASQPLLGLAVAGIPIVIVPGNHERSAIPSCLLLSHPNIHIVTKPCTLLFRTRGAIVAVAAFPCLRRDSARLFTTALNATGWAKARADVKILAVHQTFESATCGPGSYRFRSGDDVVDRDDVPSAFDYVSAGHVHRHQTLSTVTMDGPPIVYAGSPDRVSFAEANEPKGHVVIEEAGGRLVHSFEEHDVRPMSTWPTDITDLTRGQILERIEAIVKGLPKQAIAQVRLTGSSSLDTLRGMRLTPMARELRPDILFSVVAQAVDLVPSHKTMSSSCRRVSAFDHLNAPSEQLVVTSIGDLKQLPTGMGVYAMYDEAGRLLYIGKSRNIRSRIRSHHRGKTGSNYFSGWARQVACVEARPADSELEALLVEAELIRILRPPFNRQLRWWTGYRYLSPNGQSHGQLEIWKEPSRRQVCFGPFRSRGFANSVREAVSALFGLGFCPETRDPRGQLQLLPRARTGLTCDRFRHGLCAGLCAGRIGRADIEARIRRRDAFLHGADDVALCELEAQLDTAPVCGRQGKAFENLLHRMKTLRFAFDWLATIREAEALLYGLLLLPGGNGSRKAATLTPRGVRFSVLHKSSADAKRILLRHPRFTGKRTAENIGCLPKTAVDSLCIVARQLRKPSVEYQFISRLRLARLDASGLLTTAFDGTTKGSAVQ